jgi:hypothetical protein
MPYGHTLPQVTGPGHIFGTRQAESAHRCGIEERLLRRIELEGALIAKLIAAILNDPDLEMRPEQKAKFGTVVPRHLRAMDQEAA